MLTTGAQLHLVKAEKGIYRLGKGGGQGGLGIQTQLDQGLK